MEFIKNLSFETLVSILGLVGFGGIIGAFIGHLLQKDREANMQSRVKKIEAYSSLLNYSRGFMGDPTLSYEEALSYQQEFLKKFYNDILLFSSKEVIESVDKFFDTVSISHTNKDIVTDALFTLTESMRKDIGLKSNKIKERDKFYTVNTEDLKKKKGVK
ncbi:MAG: hypothetical protein UR60_C0021G0021 [Candidatus Moranbacteria bacterium GW2011_GWF2_34_56]|nr:MAG: hypothetical protein UR51_C0008G0012 [Candidatus Moranbacteria bacterium GW2011_GWF1_34_10]KKP64453.1 MAG: hypothetical protein UR60_C0021G0021 [Candidatus Moranbacteria bacterium GW2011_GWF2_34_56]HBI17101.1 hypothetical protein [Candidatus Moranbacteria bacterium]